VDPDAPDWEELARLAVAVAAHAYAPYSRFAVGAAGVADDGRVVTGCNVENASYGLTLCAECGLVSALAASGGGRLRAVSVRKGDGGDVMPCGRCRQLLWEHGGAVCVLDAGGARRHLDAVLPGAFDPSELP
jgi:cytidine deaminase